MGTSLITVGTRHVKVWRPEGSTVSTPVGTPVKALAGFFASQQSTVMQRILPGRNCLLGSLLEGTFTAVTSISPTQAFVCSESGDICLLDDSNGNQRFSSVTNVGFPISSATRSPKGDLVVAGKGVIATFKTKDLLGSNPSNIKPIDTSQDQPLEETLFLALAPLNRHVVTIDGSRIIKLIHPADGKLLDKNDVELQLPAHGGPVLGVRPLPPTDVLKASFFTWSTDGTILFWGADGICKRQFEVQLDHGDGLDPTAVNELKVVRSVASAGVMVTGDKMGVLKYAFCSRCNGISAYITARIMDEKTGKCVLSLKAHAGEITDIAVHQKRCLVASCGRDRTVQVIQKTSKSWELQQTLDEHVGAVTGLLFTADAKHLISCSSDRTVVVREGLSRTEGEDVLFAFIITRTITLKATPVSMCLLNGRSDVLLLSAIDRCVLKYDLNTGHQISTFKTADSEGGDAVVLSSLIHLTTINGTNILAGVSSTDKSLRLYDENGNIIARDWGHTEGITELTTINSSPKFTTPEEREQRCLVTVAVDGTIFIWSYGSRTTPKADLSSSMELMGVTPSKDVLAHKPPLRRVLSQSEMARFRQSSPEQEEVSTPTNATKRIHRPLEKKSSRFSLAQTPKLEPSITSYDSGSRRRTRTTRSPSPNSPNRKSPPRQSIIRRKTSSEISNPRSRQSTARASIGPGAPTSNDLASSTDIICRALRSYRRKLASSNDTLAPECLRDIERELGLTARAVGEKALKNKEAVEENVMVKILNQYSERLMEMLDERFKGVVVNGNVNKSESPSCSGTEEESSSVAIVGGN
jgi:WD40 repeat protein